MNQKKTVNQKKIAEKLDVSQQFISHWLKGKRDVKVKTAKKWAVILNIEWPIILDAPIEKRAHILGLECKQKYTESI